MKNKEIKSLGKEEIQKRLKDLRLELIKSKTQKSTQGAAIKTKEIKKTIARILTHINSKK